MGNDRAEREGATRENFEDRKKVEEFYHIYHKNSISIFQLEAFFKKTKQTNKIKHKAFNKLYSDSHSTITCLHRMTRRHPQCHFP